MYFQEAPERNKMTERKLNNSLFLHLKSVINGVLPLEYAIRAAQLVNPSQLEQLSEIDKKIKQYWLDLGACETEIEDELLMEFAWDMIQVGLPLTRTHGRIYSNKEFVEIIHHGLAGASEKFGSEVDSLRFPITRYFRICDLLNGNDISGLLNASSRCLKDAQRYEIKDNIELEKFLRGVREPIHIHPGMRFVSHVEAKESQPPVEHFGIVLDPKIEFSMSALKRQMREFLYQYAIRREECHGPVNQDHLARELINDFLEGDLFGYLEKHSITRLDGIVSVLSGLYCWDLTQQYRLAGKKAALEQAIQDTLFVYPKSLREVSEDAIKKNYNNTRLKIKKLSSIK